MKAISVEAAKFFKSVCNDMMKPEEEIQGSFGETGSELPDDGQLRNGIIYW